MASDLFMKIGTYKGESTDAKHKGEIDVLSWSWGVNQVGTTGTGGGGGAGKASFHDLTFVHHVDAASPNLMYACAAGEHIKDATMTVRKAGKTAQEFLVLKMADVFITSVSPAGHDGPNTSESVSMQFGSIKMEYKAQKPDGSLDSGIQFNWDITKNIKL
jgi:type VI secretion system secreted protein Hcp